MKKSAAAVVLLLVLGGAAYWLQADGQLKSFWPGASVANVQPARQQAAEPSVQLHRWKWQRQKKASSVMI